MSVNHFPYLPVVTNPENSLYPDGDPDRHRNLIIYSLPASPENIMQIRLEVSTQSCYNRQTNGENILLGGGNKLLT